MIQAARICRELECILAKLNDGAEVEADLREFITKPSHYYFNWHDITLLSAVLQFVPVHVNGRYAGGCGPSFSARDADARDHIVIQAPLTVPEADGVSTRQLMASPDGCHEEWLALNRLPVVLLLCFCRAWPRRSGGRLLRFPSCTLPAGSQNEFVPQTTIDRSCEYVGGQIEHAEGKHVRQYFWKGRIIPIS